MKPLNQIIIEGTLDGDVTKSTLANKSVGYIRNEDGLFQIQAWGNFADVFCQQGKQGRKIRVVGRLKCDKRTFIVAEHIEYLEEK